METSPIKKGIEGVITEIKKGEEKKEYQCAGCGTSWGKSYVCPKCGGKNKIAITKKESSKQPLKGFF